MDSLKIIMIKTTSNMQNAMLSRRPNFMYTIKQLSKNMHPYGLAWNETQGSRKAHAG